MKLMDAMKMDNKDDVERTKMAPITTNNDDAGYLKRLWIGNECTTLKRKYEAQIFQSIISASDKSKKDHG